MNASDYAAWYAAIVATLALCWEIYTYFQKGVQLKVSAKFLPTTHLGLIEVSLYNRGDAATTIESYSLQPKNSQVIPLCVISPSGIGLSVTLVPNSHANLVLDVFPNYSGRFISPQQLIPNKKSMLFLKHSASPNQVKCKVKEITSKK